MENYESPFWAIIYDQMMEGGCADWLADNRAFYARQLQDVTGPVLDCACGTGLFFLPWFEAGLDVYGFDASDAMLGALRAKSSADFSDRLSTQRLQDFSYDTRFAAICIPTNTFGMLTTQDDQIRTLTNIRRHLRDDGHLLLDLRLPGILDLAEERDGIEGAVHTWTHPATPGEPISQQIIDTRDHANQVYMNECRISHRGELQTFPMWGRWIWPSEFELLARVAGFSAWDAQGANGGPLQYDGLRESVGYFRVEA